MPKVVRKRKTNRHEKVTQVLLSGKPTSPDEIMACFKGTDQEKVLYRLSTNIYNIRLDGGVIKVHKDGRKVVAYQLMNPEDFGSDGRYMHGGTVRTVEVATEATPEVETEVVAEVESTEAAEVA